MKISVAMAACNGERFIAEQLLSIICQSLQPDEIIICDDSRTPETCNAIQPLRDRFPGLIRYYHNDRQLGVSKNFETAIGMTSGDIIFLADQDDVWEADKIKNLSLLIQLAAEPSGAFCDSRTVDSELKHLPYTHWELRGFTSEQVDQYIHGNRIEKLSFFMKRVPAAGHDMAFDAKLKELLLPFPDLPECHDTWIGLMIAAVSGWALSPQELTKFRQHSGNVSKSGQRDGLLWQLRQARTSIANDTFSWQMNLYNALLNRLNQKQCTVTPEILTLLRDRRDHSAARSAMTCNILKRLPMVCGEIKNGRYFRYARGWKSVLQDMLLRPWLGLMPK